MLLRVTGKLLLPGDVRELLGVSANQIGRLANKYNLKTDEYGESRLGQVRNSKQVEVFHYNAKAAVWAASLVGAFRKFPSSAITRFYISSRK